MHYEHKQVFVENFLAEVGVEYSKAQVHRLLEAMASEVGFLWVDFGNFRVSVSYRMEDDGFETRRWCLMFGSHTVVRVVEGVFIQEDDMCSMTVETKSFKMVSTKGDR